jgi:SIR2-like domain
MSDNVIILGAGASADAKIPLMNNFVETMWEMAIRGTDGREPLTTEDHDLMKKAMEIKDELDNYHGRVNFSDRNMEDILSILSFNEMSGDVNGREKLATFVKAISRAIELTCQVTHDGKARLQTSGSDVYRQLWTSLLARYKRCSLPTLITFNYDLVLERSLYQILVSQGNAPMKEGLDGVSIAYHCDTLERVDLAIRPQQYEINRRMEKGTTLEMETGEHPTKIDILKLHGSLNFPKGGPSDPIPPVLAVDDPLIMPPIFSKMEYGKSLNKAWLTALKRLRKTKNVIIVGYSLPSTDIYMQYFLKAGLGPNVNLNKIFVFDPLLFENDESCHAMIERYKTCFSPQLQDRIIFKPRGGGRLGKPGDFVHFVERLSYVLF